MANKKGGTSNWYEPEFKKEMGRLVLEEGRTIPSVNKEFLLGQGTGGGGSKQFRQECTNNPQAADRNKFYEENRRLRKELAEAQKENSFLKKAVAFFAKEAD